MGSLLVIQARMASTRLPGKVLADLAGRPMLQFMIERLRPVHTNLVVATSTSPADDAVADLCHEVAVPCVRGPEHDVLRRFVNVLDRVSARAVVRLTADCPLVDPAIVTQTLRVHEALSATYSSNTLIRTFPDGLDVEVVDADALRTADSTAVDAVEREHVTPYIYRRPEAFKLAALRTSELAGDERWTVDTPDDLHFVRSAVAAMGGSTRFGWAELLAKVGRRSVSGELQLRPAVPEDSEAVLRWRNDPQTVLFSGTARAVRRAQHERWFAGVVNDPGRRLFIAAVQGIAVGQARVDVTAGTGLVSIAVDPSRRSQGLGAKILAALETALTRDHQTTELAAEVHKGNTASLRLFTRAGYTQTGSREDFVLFHRPRRNPPVA